MKNVERTHEVMPWASSKLQIQVSRPIKTRVIKCMAAPKRLK